MTSIQLFQLATVAIAGIFNLIGAWQKLDQALQIHPFIKPRQNVWVWIWSALQVLFAGLICWFLLDLADKPLPKTFNEGFPTLVKAALIGIGFNALLNADETTDVWGLNLGAIYKWLIKPVTLQIHATQKRTDDFWVELRQHLETRSIDQVNCGMEYLAENLENNPNLTLTERQRLLTTVIQIQTGAIPQSERYREIIKLLKFSIRRSARRKLLDRFGCEGTFLNQYFSNQQFSNQQQRGSRPRITR
jgi:hypothetical protein